MGLRRREGCWHYRFMVGFREYTGNTGLADTERNRKAAEQVANQKQREKIAEAREERVPQTLNFATAAGLFIRYCQDVRYRKKPASAARIKTSFASLVVFFGDRAAAAIDAGQIDLYKQWRVSEHKVKDVTLRHDLHALSLFFQHGIKQHWCSRNWVREVDIPSDIDAVRMNVLTSEQEEKYFAAARRHLDKGGRANLHDLGRLMLNQGLRPEEILGAPKSAVDLERKLLYVNQGKTRAAKRTVNLTEESCTILRSRLQLQGEWLFPSQRHPARHIVKLAGSHDRACEAAGVSFVLYDLRHTFGTRMAAIGTDPFTLASIMGHANLRTIQRYVHPQAAEKLAAQERYEAAQNRGKLKVVKG